MKERNLLILILAVVLCVGVVSASAYYLNDTSNSTNDSEVNLTLNNSTDNTTPVQSTNISTDDNETKIIGDVIINGNKNYTHKDCGGHITYSGKEGRCALCGAIFDGYYVVGYENDTEDNNKNNTTYSDDYYDDYYGNNYYNDYYDEEYYY